MKEILKKILESGLVDKHVARLMEKWGMLPQGAEEQVRTATKTQFNELMEEISDLVYEDKKETIIEVFTKDKVIVEFSVADEGPVITLHGYIDRLGTFYFDIGICKEEWFAAGTELCVPEFTGEPVYTVTGRQILYKDDVPVCIAINTIREV